MKLYKQVRALLSRAFTTHSYGSALERYIRSRNPQHPADVERYTKEWERRNSGHYPL